MDSNATQYQQPFQNSESKYYPPPPGNIHSLQAFPPPPAPMSNEYQYNRQTFHIPPNGSLPPGPPQNYSPQYSRQEIPAMNGGLNQTTLTRQVSNQMLSVGIKSPESNGYGMVSALAPPLTSMPSPGSGTYSTMIPGVGSMSPAYSHYPPSPPMSGQGALSNGYYPYSSNQGPSPQFGSGYPAPQYDSQPPGNSHYQPGPPLHAGGVATDPSFYGNSQNNLNRGFSSGTFGHPQNDNLPNMNIGRTPSTDSMPASPNRPKGSVKRVNSRIDPAQMPRPIRPLDGIVYQTNSGTTTSSGRKIPPTSCTHFRVVDTGNCSPRSMRLTTTAPPTTKEIALKTSIPIALTATPFAQPEGNEEPVPIVDAGENPPRCNRCRGYVNPHVIWTDGGNKWNCNLCSMVNVTPAYYYSSLDGVGNRLDRKQRPELTHGSVDFLVGKDFCVRDVQKPFYVYAIDISQRAVASGLTMAAISAVRNSIGFLNGPPELIRVGILTFDRTIHFLQVKEDSASDPVRVLVTESDDPFAALPVDSWVLPLATKSQALALILDKLPELIPALQGYDKDGNATRTHPTNGESNPLLGPNIPYDEFGQTCPTAVMKAVHQALLMTGGRLIIFTSFSSNVGLGKVNPSQVRETQSMYGTAAELGSYALVGTALMTADTRKASADEKATLATYVSLANDCCKSFVSVDVIVASESEHLFPDYALLSEVPERTGGNFHVFTGSLLQEDDALRLQYQLQSMQQGIAGFEVMMKVRCSTGFRVEKLLGRGVYDEGVNELEVASINSCSTYCGILKHDGALKDDDKVHVQLAVLYSSATIARRCVRVHNFTTTATSSPQQVFRHADLDATVDVLLKVAVDKALRTPLAQEKDGPRAFLTETAIDILQMYRTHCSPDSSKGQLILPESLKLLPLYTLCALKHPALLDNFPGGPDSVKANGSSSSRAMTIHVRGYERAYELRRLRSLPAAQLMNSLYPRLFMLHQLDDNEGENVQLLDGLSIVKMPPLVPSLSEVLESEGMYLLEDGGALWLYVGRNVPAFKLEDWFGLNVSASGIYDKPKHLSFNTSVSIEASKMAAIAQSLRLSNWSKQELKVVWAGEAPSPDSIRFGLRLVEDSIYGNASYVDFLCKIHSKIQAKNI